MVNNSSYKTSKTRLFKEKDRLNLEFIYETQDDVFFAIEYDNEIYWLIENFKTGEIVVSDENGSIFEKGQRFLNILRLDI